MVVWDVTPYSMEDNLGPIRKNQLPIYFHRTIDTWSCVTPYIPVENRRRFRGTSVNFFQTMWRHIPEDGTLYGYRCTGTCLPDLTASRPRRPQCLTCLIIFIRMNSPISSYFPVPLYFLYFIQKVFFTELYTQLFQMEDSLIFSNDM